MSRLAVHRWGQVTRFELANPGRANVIDLEMLAALDAAIAGVQADRGVRVVVLRGTTGGTFSAGADVRQWGAMSPEQFAHDWIAHGNAVFRRFERLRCPTVAALEGPCFGGGLELALCADLRVGSTAARLRFPEVTIGAIPGWEGGTRLARIAGRGRALEAVLTARELDAQTAERWGVLNAVWPVQAFEAGLAELVDRLSTVSPHAAALTKAALVGDVEPDAFYPAAGREIKASPDAAIGLRAFFNKLPATF
jgi:enoyl-CoA hydratase